MIFCRDCAYLFCETEQQHVCSRRIEVGELEEAAAIFAIKAHAGQVRRYTNEPYVVHPAEVAEIVRGVEHTEEMLAAAWLHDVVEDCNVSLNEINEKFGETVAEHVYDLTDVSRPHHGNRVARKQLDRDHAANALPGSKTVKLADLISNTRTIVKFDPDFAKVYMKEKRLLLDVLRQGDTELWATANAKVAEYEYEKEQVG